MFSPLFLVKIGVPLDARHIKFIDIRLAQLSPYKKFISIDKMQILRK